MSSNPRITSSFLNSLKSLFPEASGCLAINTGSVSPSRRKSVKIQNNTHLVLRNPWYIVAAVAFSASNRPEGVPRVFEHVLEDLRAPGANSLPSDEKLLAQKIRDALFKSGIMSGYPKVSCASFRSTAADIFETGDQQSESVARSHARGAER